MRIVFAGSAPFSVPLLSYLLEQKLIVALLTVPDRPAGRGLQTKSTPTKKLALSYGVPVLQPEFLRKEAIAAIQELQPDLLICAAYGKIFGPKFLQSFRLGSINIHPSLLPRFRGAAPIPATLLAGDSVTGVSLQKISLQMDCGDIILQSKYTIGQKDTTETLMQALSLDSVDLVAEMLADFDNLYANARKQDECKAVYCKKIDSHLGTIQWTESAKQIELMTRALTVPYSGVKAKYKDGIIKFWKATALELSSIEEKIEHTGAIYKTKKQSSNTEVRKFVGCVLGIAKNYGILLQCAKGVLAVSELQMTGRKKLHWTEFIKGEAKFLEACLK